MNASDLRNRVLLQRPIEIRNAHGQVIKEWQDFRRVFANVRFKTGAELQRTQIDISEVTASIRIRRIYDVELNANWRLILLDNGNQLFNIKAILPDMAGLEFVDLVCVSGANEGE